MSNPNSCAPGHEDDNPGDSVTCIPGDMPSVELLGTDGNAFSIIGLCRRAGKRAGWNDDQLTAFVKEATAGDYDHVLQTAMKYFEVN
jgi:hypothetical protein